MAEIVLENVSRAYPGSIMAVNNLNLSIQDQEFLVLVGPSGCGKSTTLRLVAGLEEISAGLIRFSGCLVNDLPACERNVAMVFQNCALFPHMTVRTNMAFSLYVRNHISSWRQALYRLFWPSRAAAMKLLKEQIAEKVVEAARLLKIEHLLDRLPRQLSGGEQQRVALGQAVVRRLVRTLVRQPVVFLLDEPLSSLDANLRLQMQKELKQLQRDLKVTMLYVTHDLAEAMTLGDRIAVMHEGEIQQVGTPQEIYDHPANQFVAEFIGSSPVAMQ